jgi:PAS domain S-box-containing protein
MSAENIAKKGLLAVVFVAIIAGVFHLSREKITEDVTHCSVIAIMTAALLPYLYRTRIKSIILAAVFIAIIVGVYWLARMKITQDPAHCTLIAVVAAAIIPYLYNRYVYTSLPETEPEESVEIKMKSLVASKARLEEKVRKLTEELSTTEQKLDAEISDKPLEQKQLEQRLKHLNCLYGLSKIVNREEVPLNQIFQKTVFLIRDAHKYPDTVSVRITFDGVRYTTDDFKKSESCRNAQIRSHGKDVGLIEVYNLGGKANSDEERFLKEESNLLMAVAEWLGSITERKKAQEKLQLIRNLMELSNDCIFALEPQWGRFLDANKRACDMLGYSRKELLGMMTMKDIEESVTDDASWKTKVNQLRLNKDIVQEGLYRRKDGTTFAVETSLRFVTQEKQDYIIAIARDITERKHTEARLKSAQDKLLETAREVGKTEVATGILHNAGNVLNSISVTAESIEKRVRNSKISCLSDVVQLLQDNAEQLGKFMTVEERGKKIPVLLANLSSELIDEQQRSLESLEALTKHVQHVTEIVQLQQSHGKAKGLLEATTMDEILRDTLEINAEVLARNGIKVTKDVSNLPTLLLDRHKLLQAMTNLICNAAQALAESSRADKTIKIRAREIESGRLRIEISDNGEGIPPENLTRIFEHGFTTKTKGHGFGLHSTALAVDELHGSITAHSDGPDKGATFTIELPFQKEEAKI